MIILNEVIFSTNCKVSSQLVIGQQQVESCFLDQSQTRNSVAI